MKKQIRQLNFKDERKCFDKELERIQNEKHPVALLLDRVEDVRNIGGLFRLADAANIEKIYLFQCNFDPKNKQIQRISRSTLKYIDYQKVSDLSEMGQLKERYDLVGLEITNESIIYQDFKPKKPVLLVIGNERNGVSEAILQITDYCIHLPMYGLKTSMNVTCATAIALYDLIHKF